MNIKKLKIGQKVFIQSLRGNDTEEEIIELIDIEKDEIWLSDGHVYHSNEIFSSRQKALNT